MRLIILFALLISVTSCATSREPSSENGSAPQAVEDGSFPGRSSD